ncbi:YceI family protein [Corynebacterium sp. A21]|uniref:YceI family protein n=1 Tax=Corynebacterium sp. A21 TaxID=3457318 RepID=UPI003FD0BFD0
MSESPAPTHSRNKRLRWIIVIILAVLILLAGVLLGSRLYSGYVSSQAEDVPTLSSSANTPSSQDSPAPATDADLSGSWTVTDGSYAGYRVDEVLNGSEGTVTGRTGDISGSLTVAEQELTATELTLQIESITTDSSRRDNYFRTTAIDSSQHPEATFTLTEPVDLSTAAVSGTQTYSVSGDLTLNGLTRPVTAEVQSAFGEGTAQLVGQIPTTWSDFGVQAPNLGFVAVEDSGFIEFSLNVTQE